MTRPTLETLTEVQVADVYKAGRLVATLRRVEAGIDFTYRDDHLASEIRPVATTVPLTDERVHPMRAPGRHSSQGCCLRAGGFPACVGR